VGGLPEITPQTPIRNQSPIQVLCTERETRRKEQERGKGREGAKGTGGDSEQEGQESTANNIRDNMPINLELQLSLSLLYNHPCPRSVSGRRKAARKRCEGGNPEEKVE